MPSHAPPPAGPARARRGQRAILDAGEALFGARGYAKASVEEIAAAAGVSKPLVYRYFRSKRQLFEAVVARVIDEWCELISAEGARATPSAAHTLRGIVRASLDFARAREVLRGLLARESQLLLAGYSDVLERGTATLRRVLSEALERGALAGEIRGDLAVGDMADVIAEVCVRFVDRLLAGDARDAAGGALDAIVETLLYGVVVHARTAAAE